MEAVKTFVVNLVTTLIFISAIELICPDNKMKKYIKFVLGLILIAVILNPIITFFTKGEVFLNEAIDSYEKELSVSTISKKEDNKEEESYINKNFKENLNKNIEAILKEAFSKYDFKCTIDCTYNNTEFNFKKISIGVSKKGIKKIEKVDLKNSYEKCNDEDLIEIKNYLSKELEVSQDIIEIYYM